MTQGLTTQQDRMLGLLKASERTPSYRQMQDALGTRSMSSISRIIEDLEAKGLIERLPNRARAIRVVPNPRPWAESLLDEQTDALIAEVRRRGFTVEARA
jgi:SOS-response transcriptional repressor LexA